MPKFESQEHLRRYIIATAISRVVDEQRRVARRRGNEAVLWSAVSPEQQPDPESEMISHEQSERLRSAIAALPEPYLSIFTLLLYEELSLADIARHLGSRLGSIYTQYSRGLARLRKSLQGGA